MNGHSPSILTITTLFTNTVLTMISKYSVSKCKGVAPKKERDYPLNQVLLQPL
jgi:hypothetical protein